MPFENTDNQDLRFDPLLVTVYPNGTTLTADEQSQMWSSLKDISEEHYQLLRSPLLAKALQGMQIAFQLDEQLMQRLASLMRELYCERIVFEQFPMFLKNNVGVPEDKIVAIMRFIQTEMVALRMDVQGTPQERTSPIQTKMVSMTLLQALEKYARINDQQLTSERIRIRSERESVRGTVRNWLRAYRDVAGFGKHEAVMRGQFLFQSDNGKKLASDERERVALLLKALDENEMVAVDGQKQIIVFPVIPQKPKERETPLAPQPRAQELPPSALRRRPQSSFNFSSSQKTSEEKSMVQPNPLQQIIAKRNEEQRTVPTPATLPMASSKNPFRFSSGQVLPSEKQDKPLASAINPAPKTASSFGVGFTPTQSAPAKKEVWQVPSAAQNVVNLRAEER